MIVVVKSGLLGMLVYFEHLNHTTPPIGGLKTCHFSGKITYTPDTPLVREIIKEANATFEAIAFVQILADTWKSTTGPAIYQQLENGTNTNQLRVWLFNKLFLSTSFYSDVGFQAILNNNATILFLTSQTNITSAQIEQLRVFLSNDDNPNDNVTTWKDVYRQFTGLVEMISQVRQRKSSNTENFIAVQIFCYA